MVFQTTIILKYFNYYTTTDLNIKQLFTPSVPDGIPHSDFIFGHVLIFRSNSSILPDNDFFFFKSKPVILTLKLA